MWWRAAVGLVALVVGGIWIGQGVGAVHGSFMTGHSQYTGLGVVLGLGGLGMLAWSLRVRAGARRADPTPGPG